MHLHLHHVLVDSSSALQYCEKSEAEPHRVQIVSKELYTVILRLLRASKCSNFTFHGFNSLLPSTPPCRTLQMNSNALQNLKNEIATNLHLTSSTPSSTAGSDGRASLSGVLKVLQRLMRKLHSSRSIYSTKPTKHVVYLFGCGPYSAHESSSPETLTSTFSQGEKNISQSSNILCDTLAKLKEHNMHLVWICYGPREQLLKSVVSGLNKVNPTDRWAQYQSYVELKDFRDLFTATEPISRLLAFSLENKLRENATSGKQRQNKRKGNGISRIVFEKRGKGHRNQLFCLSNVRIQSAVNSKQQNEHETTFLVSHYLKDWDSSSFPKGSTEAKPKTLKPKATEDAQAFNSFMLFLVRTKAVAVATEIVVDHKNQNLSSRLVVIAPFNSMIASVCRIPFHIKQRILQGSSSPVTYSQWKKCCTNEMKRMGTELTGADASSEVYNEYISTPTVGSTRKECLDTVDIDRLPKKHQSPPGSAAIFKDDKEDSKTPPISSSGDDFHANKPTTLHSKLFIHEKGTYSSKLAKSSTVPTASKNVVAKKSLKSAVNVTKHGFRYKRVYANKQTANGQVEQSNPGGGLRLTKPNVSTSELVVPDSTLESSRLVLSKTTPCFKSAGKVSGSKDCKSRNIKKAVGWSSAVESESLCTQNRQSPLVSQNETGCSSQRDLEAQRLTAATAPTASITEVEKVQVTQSKKPTECNADLGATEGRRNHAFSKGVQSPSTHKTIHQNPLASLSPERVKRPRSSMVFKLATQTNPRHVKLVGRKKLGSLHIIETDTDDKRMANSNERPFYAHQQQNSPSADPYFASNEQGAAHEGGGKGGITIDAEHQSLQRAEPRLKSSKARRTSCERTTGNKIEIVQKESFFNSPESLGVSAVPPFEQPKPSSNSETVSLLQFDGAPSVGVRLTTYISDATREFDGVINQLLNHAPETGERLVRRAMAQLSKIAKHIANSQCSWPQIYSILKSRLKADDHVIASMQAEQNSYFSKEHGQVKTMNGRLWKVVLEAFEQVIWLLVGVMDPKLKTSLKSDSKQELFRRATTILSCAQITAELMSSGFDSSLVFRRVLDSFFHTTLSHFAQASQNVNLKHWTGIVFEHFEKDVPSAGSFGISADDSKPAKPLRGIDQTSCSEDTKPITRTLSGGRYQKAPRSNLSSFLQGRKRSVRKTGPLHNNPAFRRGKPFAFGGVSKKKVNPTNIESLSKPACPSQVLDKLIHMGSLQSSLDAIQVPQTKEHGVCEEEVEATDDETEGASLPISHTTPELGIKSCPEDEPRKSDAFCSGVQITEVPCRSKASFGIEDISTKDETSTKMASGFTAVSKLGTDVEIPSNLSGPSNGKRGRMSRRCSPNKAQEKRDAHQGITDRYASDRSPCTKMKETDKEQNLRNEKVKCMRKDPEAHAESTTNPQLNTKTQQDLDGQVSTVCELPNNETSKAMERCSVKKRKLQLKNESTPHASVEDTDEPSPKKPRTAEQKPTLSLFGRIREVVSKSINLGGCSLGGS